MPLNPQAAQEKAAAYWRSYFAQFRRRVEDRWSAQSQSGYAYAAPAEPLPFPDRRRPHPNRFTLLR
jgi:hypothetical protein